MAMPGVPARLAPPGVTAHEPGHDHLPPPRPPSPLGLGAKPAALGIRRRPMRPSAAANIDASPSSGRRGRPFDAVDGRCQGLLSQSEHGSENRYHHRLTLPGPRPRLPPLKAFGCRPSAPAPNPVQGPATETLNISRHWRRDDDGPVGTSKAVIGKLNFSSQAARPSRSAEAQESSKALDGVGVNTSANASAAPTQDKAGMHYLAPPFHGIYRNAVALIESMQ